MDTIKGQRGNEMYISYGTHSPNKMPKNSQIESRTITTENKKKERQPRWIAEKASSKTNTEHGTRFIVCDYTIDCSLSALFFIIIFLLFDLMSVRLSVGGGQGRGRERSYQTIPITYFAVGNKMSLCTIVPFSIDVGLDKSNVVCGGCCCFCCCCRRLAATTDDIALAAVWGCYVLLLLPRAVIRIELIRFVSLMIILPPMANNVPRGSSQTAVHMDPYRNENNTLLATNERECMSVDGSQGAGVARRCGGGGGGGVGWRTVSRCSAQNYRNTTRIMYAENNAHCNWLAGCMGRWGVGLFVEIFSVW